MDEVRGSPAEDAAIASKEKIIENDLQSELQDCDAWRLYYSEYNFDHIGNHISPIECRERMDKYLTKGVC